MAHTYRDIPGAGSKLSMEVGYASVEIPGVSEINWDGFKRGMRTPTPLSATAAVKKPGMPDFGQLKTKCFFDPNDSTHQAIRDSLTASAASKSANLDSFTLAYADGFATPAHVLITGFVADFSHASGDAETGTWAADLTIEVVTAVFTAGAPAE
jgi:hypothetical protein